MKRPRNTTIVVAVVTLMAAASVLIAWGVRSTFPGNWELLCFIAVGFLLDQTSNRLRVDAAGSTSFVIHLAAGLLFGAFWAAAVVGVSQALSQLARRKEPTKLIFNVAQRILSIVLAVLVYQYLGGDIPPAYMVRLPTAAPSAIQRDLGLFFVFAATYFAVNTIAVSVVVAVSSGRPFREVWHFNARGALGYDIVASLISIPVAYLYRWTEEGSIIGSMMGPFSLLLVVGLIVVVRHTYGMYRKLQESGRELLDLMVKAIEARDPYTSGHSIRVATLAKAIALESGMSAPGVEEVYTAALLHDVGKIHEEFAPLLRKDSKLTAEETALLQTHSVKSAELVGIISSFRGNVQDSVRSHHERWDGQGYPDGIVGEDIPLGARIIMISDTTDAMTSDRPYRKRLGLDSVIAELQRYKGAQFDPKLVDIAINSVAVRRVITSLQAPADGEPIRAIAEGGSTRVRWKNSPLWKARQAF